MIKHYFLLALCLLSLSGCQDYNNRQEAAENRVHRGGVTQKEVNAANMICYNQLKADEQNRNPKRLSRWAKCKRTHVMQFDQKGYPGHDAEIMAMNDEMISGMLDVEAGRMSLEQVYRRWDTRKLEIGMAMCKMRFVARNGEQRCLDPGANKHVYEIPIGK